MAYDELKEAAYRANLAIVDAGLVVLTWGNASVADRAADVMAIKPSGVAYAKLRAEDMVVLSLSTGEVIDGTHRPSSDTPTHLHLFRSFKNIGAVVHTHSVCATSFAQAKRDIPCLGTTHADHFFGPVPVTREMAAQEIASDYEWNTGRVIVECFEQRRIDPDQVPGVIVASHAPFTWGPNADKAVENAVVLEVSAQMALHSLALDSSLTEIPDVLLRKHFFRKHGPKAYYGQGR